MKLQIIQMRIEINNLFSLIYLIRIRIDTNNNKLVNFKRKIISHNKGQIINQNNMINRKKFT